MDDPTVQAYRTLILQPIKHAIKMVVPGASTVDVEFVRDVIVDNITMHVQFSIWGQRNIGRHEKTKTIIEPATWFDAWLMQTRLGRFVARWRKPEKIEHKLTVVVTTDVVLPEWTHQLPHAGTAVLIAQPDSYYDTYWTK